MRTSPLSWLWSSPTLLPLRTNQLPRLEGPKAGGRSPGSSCRCILVALTRLALCYWGRVSLVGPELAPPAPSWGAQGRVSGLVVMGAKSFAQWLSAVCFSGSHKVGDAGSWKSSAAYRALKLGPFFILCLLPFRSQSGDGGEVPSVLGHLLGQGSVWWLDAAPG